MENWRTTGSQNMAKQSDIPVANGSFTASLPAQSVTTFVGSLGGTTSAPIAKNTLGGYAPLMTVKGRTLSVNSNVRIRIVDMRGKTMAKFNIQGGSNLSLKNIPAGSYIIEAKRLTDGIKMTSAVVLK
jgi:hypothetical protein